MRLICGFKACTRKLLVYQNWTEGLKTVHVFAVDKEIEKTRQKRVSCAVLEANCGNTFP